MSVGLLERLGSGGTPATAAPLVLVAHGSRDPRSARTMRRLAAGVEARWPAPVTVAFLDFDRPTVPHTLAGLSHWPAPPASSTDRISPIVVPALLTSAYHGRVDVPDALAAAGVAARLAAVLGPSDPGQPPDPRLLSALMRRLSELDDPTRYDGLVLIAAGTSYPSARSTVENVAAALSTVLSVPCVAGYASASGPTGAEAVATVRALGATHVAVVSYFLAPGRLYDAAAASTRSAGVVGVAAPLGDATELVDLVVARALSVPAV